MSVTIKFWPSSSPTDLKEVSVSNAADFRQLLYPPVESESEVKYVIVTATPAGGKLPWLKQLLSGYCLEHLCSIIFNMEFWKFLPGTNSIDVYPIDYATFIDAYCLRSNTLTIQQLRSIEALRYTDDHDLKVLQSALAVNGWRQDQYVILNSDKTILLDGATRVFILAELLHKPQDVVPVVICLASTPAWIVGEHILNLSQTLDRRKWTPGDALNLACYKFETMEKECVPDADFSAALRLLQKNSCFAPYSNLVNLAFRIRSRTLGNVLSRNISISDGAVKFFNKFTVEETIGFYDRVFHGWKHCSLPISTCKDKAAQFVQDVSKTCKHSVSAHKKLNMQFNDEAFFDNSRKFGVRVTKTEAGCVTSLFDLGWNSETFCHESSIARIQHFSQWQHWALIVEGVRVATKAVLKSSCVPALGCMQGDAQWCCVNPRTSDGVSIRYSVVALSERISHQSVQEVIATPHSDTAVTSTKRPRSDAQSTVRGNVKLFDIRGMHHVMVALNSYSEDFKTMWNHLQDGFYSRSINDFLAKLELQLNQLLLYHATLYNDKRFAHMAPLLIADARNIKKGKVLSEAQLCLLRDFFVIYGWLETPVLWDRAELLLLLNYVFDPHLLFVHVNQSAEGSADN
jgi:hypothetical protein